MRVERIMEFVRGPDVLDVGCTGHVVTMGQPEWVHGRLRERFPMVCGIDIHSENVALMRDAGFDVSEGDAQSFDLSREFDTIVAGELIEHLENPSGLFASSLKHLKPDGQLILTTPYPFGLPYFLHALHKFPQTCANQEHTVWFCPSTLRAMGSRMGFAVQHWELMPGDPFDTWSLRSLMLRGVSVLPRRLRGHSMLFVFVPITERSPLREDPL